MMSEKAYIEFRTHAVTITRDEDRIHCFKFAGSRAKPFCDYQIFTDETEATEWIVQPFSLDRFEVILE